MMVILPGVARCDARQWTAHMHKGCDITHTPLDHAPCPRQLSLGFELAGRVMANGPATSTLELDRGRLVIAVAVSIGIAI
jgi:hypothetical protein